MNTFKDQLSNQFKFGGMYMKLIMINVAVFLVFMIINLFSHLMMVPTGYIDQYFVFYSHPSVFIKQPWGIITYMFMHAGLMHLVLNMLIFFFMGKMLEQFMGSKKMLSTYILGGIAGALIFFIAQNSFPLLRMRAPVSLLGASGSVMAVLAATATYAPRMEVFIFGIIRMPLFAIAIIMALMDLTSLASSDGIAHFAHLGGLLYGFVFASLWKKGKDISAWFDRLVSFLVGIFKRKPKMKVEYSKYRKTAKGGRSKGDKYAYNEKKIDRQAKLDAILDKIKISGYDGLTKEEKDFLANY